MNYAVIKKTDVADGPGIRVGVFVSGCRHGCKGCFNREAWDFHYGQEYTEETEEEILQALAPDYIRGLSLLGGEPLAPENRETVLKLVKTVRHQYPDKDIWCYTGYDYEKDLLGWVAQEEREGQAASAGQVASVEQAAPAEQAIRTGQAASMQPKVVTQLLELIDVLVDGEFVEEEKNLRLPFRGSENQRIIDVRESQRRGEVVCLQL